MGFVRAHPEIKGWELYDIFDAWQEKDFAGVPKILPNINKSQFGCEIMTDFTKMSKEELTTGLQSIAKTMVQTKIDPKVKTSDTRKLHAGGEIDDELAEASEADAKNQIIQQSVKDETSTIKSEEPFIPSWQDIAKASVQADLDDTSTLVAINQKGKDARMHEEKAAEPFDESSKAESDAHKWHVNMARNSKVGEEIDREHFVRDKTEANRKKAQAEEKERLIAAQKKGSSTGKSDGEGEPLIPTWAEIAKGGEWGANPIKDFANVPIPKSFGQFSGPDALKMMREHPDLYGSLKDNGFDENGKAGYRPGSLEYKLYGAVDLNDPDTIMYLRSGGRGANREKKGLFDVDPENFGQVGKRGRFLPRIGGALARRQSKGQHTARQTRHDQIDQYVKGEEEYAKMADMYAHPTPKVREESWKGRDTQNKVEDRPEPWALKYRREY